MSRLRQNSEVIVYHDVDEEGNHTYYLYDGRRKVTLDWGVVGHIPNRGDRFTHPRRDIDLRLSDIVWPDDC